MCVPNLGKSDMDAHNQGKGPTQVTKGLWGTDLGAEKEGNANPFQ